jgi:hypothetical protein
LKNTVIDVSAKIIALGLIFIAPIIYLIWKYGGSETEVIEITTNSMPIAILILITVFVIVLVLYIGSSTMSAIKDSPFGYGGIYMYGTLIGAISFLGIYWIDKVADLIDYDSTQFLLDLATYKHSVQVVLTYIVAGLVIATAGFIYKKTQ